MYSQNAQQVGVASGVTGIVIMDFGQKPTMEASVIVTGQKGLTANSMISAWFQCDNATYDTPDYYQLAIKNVQLTVTEQKPGVGFRIMAESDFCLWNGQLRVQWRWS